MHELQPDLPRRVAIIVETSKHYGRQLLRGIARFRHYATPWSIYIEERALDDPEPKWLGRWDGDGIISRNDGKTFSRQAEKRGVAVVNLRYTSDDETLPSFFSSEEQITDLALEHFVERGFVNFAYCGVDTPWAAKRGQTFATKLEGLGHGCAVFPLTKAPTSTTWEREQSALVTWIESLPKPVAVLAANDPRGLQVLDACRRAGADVPREIAVLGIDNDPELCALAHPPLSSVDQGAETIGYLAAELLGRLMAGELPPEQTITHCDTASVVTRQSTDTLAIADAHIRSALLFIAQHVESPISVDDVVKASGISRRALEIRFREQMQTTIRARIQIQKIRLLKRLLKGTNLTLDQIAERVGYGYTEHMVTMFRREVGETPGEFRKRVAR